MPTLPEEQFRAELSRALRAWIKKNGYKYATHFVRELKDVDESVFKRVLKGEAVAQDPSLYAQLYMRTGLVEADPRRLPPRIRVLNNVERIKDRAWSETEWQEWLKRHKGFTPKPVSSQVATPIPLPEVESSDPSALTIKDIALPPVKEHIALPQRIAAPQTVGGLLDQWLAMLGTQLNQPVMEQLSGISERLGGVEKATSRLISEVSQRQLAVPEHGSQNQPPSATNAPAEPPEEVDELAQWLLGEVKRAFHGSEEDRDRLIQSSGDTLFNLERILSVLVRPRKERELEIPLARSTYRD